MITLSPHETEADSMTSSLIDDYDLLAELSLDIRSSLSHGADARWRELDPELWEITRHLWAVLQTVFQYWIENIFADPVFQNYVDQLIHDKRQSKDALVGLQIVQGSSHVVG